MSSTFLVLILDLVPDFGFRIPAFPDACFPLTLCGKLIIYCLKKAKVLTSIRKHTDSKTQIPINGFVFLGVLHIILKS